MVMVNFGYVEQFLNQNEDIGPTSRPKLLEIYNDPQKKDLLQIEMAATVDWGEPLSRLVTSWKEMVLWQ